MQASLAFSIIESSQVGAARRAATGMAIALGFSETEQGELALIVTEIAANLVRHAVQGELFLRVIEAEDRATSEKETSDEESLGIEILAVDKGPGMSSISQCLQDGYSTAGTAGNGLGAIARLSRLVEIYSVPGEGTALLSQFWSKAHRDAPVTPVMEQGAVNRPKPGQEVCGDFWGVAHLPERSLYFLADGLGHGPDAALASHEAVRAFRKHRARTPKAIMEAVHAALRGTRGAAAAVAEIDYNKQEVCFAGIGNIAGSIVSPAQHQSMVSHNGIVGHQVRKVQEFVYPWTRNALLILHSDGVSTRWQLERYPGLTTRHPGLIAGILYRDFKRDYDDATVLVGAYRSLTVEDETA